MIVIKFGGTSVADAEAIRRSGEIVRGRLDRQPVVVVSALAGTTNQLIAIGEQAAKGHLIGAVRAVEALRDRHLQQAELLLGTSEEASELSTEMASMFDELASLAEALSVLGDLTPRSMDAIAAKGEQLSSLLVAAAYRHMGLPAVHVDARDVMITNGAFTHAEPNVDRIAETSRERLLPLLRDGKVPVLGGFIGANAAGVTTTLGRGGSDYSAALFGAALRGEAIEIWTDVDGMLTADPRVVPSARLIERIGFEEASELASFGAKVLHPMTIAPAVRLGIPVCVLNSRRPDGSGTLITFDTPERDVTAVAAKTGVTVVKVRSPRMLLTEGTMRRIFEVFERHGISVDVVATSEVSVSLTVDQVAHLDEAMVDLRDLGDVSVERNRGVLSIVGSALSTQGTAMSRALGCLGGIRVHMLSLSASGINLTVVVDGDEVNPLMQRLHAEFFPEAA